MKPLRSMPLLLVMVSILAVFSGCARKKPVLVVPQEQPPAIVPTPAPSPQGSMQPQSDQHPVTQAEQQPAPEQPAKTAEKPAKTKSHRRAPAKTEKSEAARRMKEDTVAEAKAADLIPAPISPTISASEAARDQTSTDQLLQSTETNLNGIKRQLTKEEEAIVGQIRNYVAQSRQAIKDNDPGRAHNLAVKANLLSNELARR
ncbi:MAG TPA: hypothetical protein VLT16_13335 [Candidatus Limnocylindrales bacterium]|nr:hypothetical protein [Candidatus Limnocylindrales bacterium]